jgi:hypothetical protein
MMASRRPLEEQSLEYVSRGQTYHSFKSDKHPCHFVRHEKES